MDEEASKFGLRVSWTKTKIQNLGSGSTPLPVTVDGNTVDPVEEFIYLGSIQSSHSNSGPEYIRCIGLAASAMKRLDCCQRRILHISWHDFVSNDEVLHRTGLFDVSYIVRKRRLGLFGHVAIWTSKRCSSKLDPLNLCQDEGW